MIRKTDLVNKKLRKGGKNLLPLLHQIRSPHWKRISETVWSVKAPHIYFARPRFECQVPHISQILRLECEGSHIYLTRPRLECQVHHIYISKTAWSVKAPHIYFARPRLQCQVPHISQILRLECEGSHIYLTRPCLECQVHHIYISKTAWSVKAPHTYFARPRLECQITYISKTALGWSR